MVHLVRIVIATCVALLFNSCKYDVDFGEKITGSGHVVTKERNLDPFTKIEVSKGLDCEVTQGNDQKVIIEADDNLQDGIITTVSNGVLKISSKYNNYHNLKSKMIKVQIPNISSLETTSAASLVTKNIIKGNNIALKSSSASNLNAKIEADQITLEATSGSDLNVEGKALEVTTSSSSGSSIDAKNLLANNINSQSSSGSTTIVNPILKLKAHASSGSSIGYSKTPKSLTIEENSGGSVDKE
ncbi:MAG: head GIN domain-containing protein [Flavobacterium sp.]|uniref:head GIN domain-containing protein n=1 Tax=Flavobacterium sp. TaxID=239 RepID=UPI00326711E9